MENTYDFTGKVALITGAASGLGRSTAEEFLKAGAKVALVDINEKKLRDFADKLEYTSDRYIVVIADVSKEADIIRYVEETKKAFGKIDVFFNNAGIGDSANVKDISEEQLDRIWGINVKGILFGMKHVIPVMEANGGGSIINTGSVDSFNTDPGNALYASSKHAIKCFS